MTHSNSQEERTLRQTDRSRLRRIPERGHPERDTVDAILDEAFVSHLAFVHQGQPTVVPLLHVRLGDWIYLHGSPATRLLRSSREGLDVSFCATLLDGLVLARSAFHHSVNYRSVVLYGTLHLVEDEAEKRQALDALVERTVRGRSADCREASAEELRKTAVARLRIEEGMAKVREGDPVDDAEDHALKHWAGVIPLRTERGTPVPDALLDSGIELPDYLQGWA